MAPEMSQTFRRFHIAIGVSDVAASIADYSARLGCAPATAVEGQYALWRTDTLNFSIRFDASAPGKLRHLGWEDTSAVRVSMEQDVNGITWEHFSAPLQLDEIKNIWPTS